MLLSQAGDAIGTGTTVLFMLLFDQTGERQRSAVTAVPAVPGARVRLDSPSDTCALMDEIWLI